MKKLYTLLLASATILGASAAPTLVSNNATDEMRNEALTMQARTSANGPMRAANWDMPNAIMPPSGEYTVVGVGQVSEGMLCDLVDGIESGEIWEITIEKSVKNPYWYRTQIYNENSPIMDVTGEPDEAYFYFNIANKNKVYSFNFDIAGIFTILQYSKSSGMYDGLSQTGKDRMDANGEKFGKYDANTGIISFPAGSFYCLNEVKGMFEQLDQYSTFSIAMPGFQLQPVWVNLGVGEFEDGIIASGFTFTDPNNPDGEGIHKTVTSDVEIYLNSAVPGMYQVRGAWMEVFGDLGGTKHFYVDASNPAMVNVPQQPTGITTDEDGEWYIMSHSLNYANPAVDFPADTEKFELYNITMANNVISFPGNACYMYWPDKDTDHLYTWKEGLASKLTIPDGAGVGNVVVEDQYAPVEYYNLSGIRVANPSAGIYIMRQGNKATKVYIR